MSEPRLCPCHGEPMYEEKGQGRSKWRCAVKHRAWQRKNYHQRRKNDPVWIERRKEIDREGNRRVRQRRADEGRCIRCGADDPIGAVCWNCLNDMEVNRGIRL